MPAKPKLAIADVLAQVRPREQVVTVCLRGDLAAEHARLEAELSHPSTMWAPSSMADVDPRRDLGERIRAVEEEMRASSVDFRFRALSGPAWSDLLAKHPGRTAQEVFDPEGIQAPLLAACCVDPAMSEDEARQLLDALNEGQRVELFNAAFLVNQEPPSVPFSQIASAALGITAQK